MLRTLTSALTGAVIAAGLLIGPAASATLTAEDKANVARVEKYFNEITSMRSINRLSNSGSPVTTRPSPTR